jgi:cytochrome c-type biogenesis protein CcmH/NrfF
MLGSGRSEKDVLDWYVARYSERILASPPAHGFNRLAYILPWSFSISGMIILVIVLRALRAKAAVAGGVPPSLDAGMEHRIAEELRELESQEYQ